MPGNRRTPDDWHALGQFCTQIAFAICLVGVCAGVLYCLVFVTQPMTKQSPNDAVLFELLKTVAVSMISIIGTLMAVGHGSNASSLPTTLVAPPASPPAPPKPMIKPIVKPVDDEPPFKGARE